MSKPGHFHRHLLIRKQMRIDLILIITAILIAVPLFTLFIDAITN